jgi:hypothetical protein
MLAVVARGRGTPNSETPKRGRVVNGGWTVGWMYVVDGGVVGAVSNAKMIIAGDIA